MNTASILILVGVAVLVIIAIIAIRRGKTGCCTDCDTCGKSGCKVNDYFKEDKE